MLCRVRKSVTFLWKIVFFLILCDFCVFFFNVVVRIFVWWCLVVNCFCNLVINVFESFLITKIGVCGFWGVGGGENVLFLSDSCVILYVKFLCMTIVGNSFLRDILLIVGNFCYFLSCFDDIYVCVWFWFCV